MTRERIYLETIERILDLAKPAVRDYVEGHILRIIERYRLDMFRLDYNIDGLVWEIDDLQIDSLRQAFP